MQRVKVVEALLAIMVGFMVFYFIFKIDILLYISFGIGLISLFWNWLAEKIAWVWLKFAGILGVINGKILLSVVFFIFLTPIAFMNKLFSKNMLQLKKEDQNSVFVERNVKYKKEDLENIF
ncbi:hypothetical protein Fleli_3928 [Bernardetia litoralis DSM 6794]|uniref:SxtJ n=1 Tax=Bernardetia litoralis (strain ATCC 23117 / DSM 6794 / NBRC 15988 / NCIMB 1366 / Fx l1 / Sio-4) TaxID=880071 RepID=I4AQJ6_BERLS|nr:hypothetical protein [Bernardetia litoralis]AFM06231.1 hypothetical protein Fleli_3928 [Bernardetia litoralis DSM 6794]